MTDPSPPPSSGSPSEADKEDYPAVLETPTEVVTTGIHYRAAPPPYSTLKNAPIEGAALLPNTITIIIKCPSCLGFLAHRDLKTTAPLVSMVISGLELFLLLVAYGNYYHLYGKAASITAVVISLIVSVFVVTSPIKVAGWERYGPLATFMGSSVMSTMHLCNAALSFYMTAVQYWNIWPFVVNGILSLLAFALTSTNTMKMLTAGNGCVEDRGVNEAELTPVTSTDSNQRTIYWKECMLLSIIGTFILIDDDRGQYVMFVFELCVLLVSTMFTFPTKMIPKDFERYCDIAHVELGLAASAIAVSVLNIVYSSFIIGRGYLSGAMRTELIVSVLFIACALQVIVHIMRHVRIEQRAEPSNQGNLVRNMTVAGHGEKKPMHTQLV